MKLIIVDDSKEYMTLIRRMLASVIPDIEVTEYDPEQKGRPGDDFDWGIYDVLLIDYQLGIHDNGLDWIERYHGSANFPPAILMTSVGDEYVAARAIKLGASDFIKKADMEVGRIAPMVRAAVAEREAQLSPDDTIINSKLDNDAYVFGEVKLSNDRTPNGHRIGYRFVRLIGQGASSRVYLAERTSDRTTMVLKIMDVATIKEPQALQRFVQEAELVSELDSPYVVHFLEHGFTKDYGYIAMEFFTRGDLKQRLEHGVSVEDAINYIRHIGFGLSAIHAHGIVHRDLKPGNIMFRSDDSLALADFGISKRLDEPGELTKLGSVLGTPNYISPEQALGNAIDQRSDLYSAGVIFFEMLTGRKPFKAETAPALVYQHVHAPIPQLPNPVYNYQPIIEMLLAKDPNGRFASAEEFISSLEAIGRASQTVS
ncbi:MAG: tRNA A-37 threonylcarbamoyl transferase component Bud32/ActR [Gammaproteobacteria bacterium]|jgi:tRNA A-37 threonylcarbamoyl transferase component Bud32/ActR/RegA family two-component response regulator